MGAGLKLRRYEDGEVNSPLQKPSEANHEMGVPGEQLLG
jgi:hypothetical protein